MPATITRGKTFGATESVTNTKLHELVDNAQISGIDQTNLEAGLGLVVRSTSAPSDTDAVWVDTSVSPPLLKIYTGAAWVSIFTAPQAPVTLTDGATPALDASLGRTFKLTAAGDRTIAVPTNPSADQKIIIEHVASGADRTLALNSGTGGFRFGSDITGLTITASGKTDYIGCRYNSTANKWDVIAYVKGY